MKIEINEDVFLHVATSCCCCHDDMDYPLWVCNKCLDAKDNKIYSIEERLRKKQQEIRKLRKKIKELECEE